MNEEVFSLKAQHELINQRFISNGWITVYRGHHKGDKIDTGIYCLLVKPEYLEEYMKDRDWGIRWGSEGHPSNITHFREGSSITEYFRFSEEGMEPFIYPKWFSHVKERYADVSQEFVNYFNLFETAASKQERSYYFIDDSGDAEEVIKVSEREVRIKLKFMVEYLAVRKIHLSLCFDFMMVIKKTFGAASGNSPSNSSSASWASSDLSTYMSYSASNAPLYIEAFFDGWQSLGTKFPELDIDVINAILADSESRYQIKDGQLLFNGPELIPSPQPPKSLLEEARKTIEVSLKEGDKLFREGRYRPAVQEILWLLETIVTAFDGMEIDGQTIQGKYFNKIIEKLAEKTDRTTLKQVIEWVRKLHGYLSAPAGGGIRHGSHLAEGVATTQNEAHLYYNLSKSYIIYFLGEYETLKEITNTVKSSF